VKTSITKAVVAVMSEIHRLGKDDRNDHGKYAYVSVDKVKDAIRPLLVKNGLDVRVTEVSHDFVTLESRNGSSTQARYSYSILLRHESGEADDPDVITICLPHTGAQTSGAARSYAVKEWIKGRFMLSTGEKDEAADADSHKQEEYTRDRIGLTGGTPGASKAPLRPEFDRMLNEVRALASITALQNWKATNVNEIDALPPEWFDELQIEYSDKKAELTRRAAA
jgi:hypothetical protein